MSDEKYSPKEGHEWNPLLKFPRNAVCYCGSKIKFKKCCLKKQTLAVDARFAEQAKPLVNTIRRVG